VVVVVLVVCCSYMYCWLKFTWSSIALASLVTHATNQTTTITLPQNLTKLCDYHFNSLFFPTFTSFGWRDGWNVRPAGWRFGRIQGKLHFLSRRILQYMIIFWC
jgi:hypothetical protein